MKPVRDLSRTNDAGEALTSLSPPVPISPLPTLHNPVSYLSSDWAVAYLIATVIFGIGAVIGSITYVSHHVQVAERLPAVTRSQLPPELHREFVGRITGMVDCKWADSSTTPVSGHVAVGHKFALSSGLMEITYDTGAKVVLQGPVNYEVESPNSGYLSLGKLTARVEKKVASGQRPVASKSGIRNLKSEISNPQSPTPNPSLSTTRYPLFTIKTPTAVVTDLGTEFGVEVDKLGGTKSHVFRGSVKLETVSADGASEVPPRILHANESAQVRKNDDKKGVAIYSVKVDPASFVRAKQLPQINEERQLKPFRRWQAFSKELRKDPSLLAYYDFQRQKDSPTVLRNVAASGSTSLDGTIMNAMWGNGRMAGKHALRFGGQDEFVEINLPQKVNDLTLAAWVHIDSLNSVSSGLVMSSRFFRDGQMHWQLAPSGHIGFNLFESTKKGLDSQYFTKPVININHCNRWTHFAVTYDHAAGNVKFYLDCNILEEKKIGTHVPICIGEARIGQWNPNDPTTMDFRKLFGWIDELAIFSRPLAAEEIQSMFEAGKPSEANR